MPAQAVFDIVHRAADPLPGGAALPVVDCQRDLGKFSTHAQDRRTPHPEHRARAANGDSARNTRNVAGTHRARQRRAHRLKRRHRTVGGIFFSEHTPDCRFDGIWKLSYLQKVRAHAEHKPHADDAHHSRYAPHKVVDRRIDSRNRFKNHCIPLLLIFRKKRKACNADIFCRLTSLFVRL